MNATCSAEGCGNQTVAKGWCKKHYQQVRKWGAVKETEWHPCAAAGCTEQVLTATYCVRHKKAMQRHGEPVLSGHVPWTQSAQTKPCANPDCANVVYHAKYCRTCAKRVRRNGTAERRKSANNTPLWLRVVRLRNATTQQQCWEWQGFVDEGGYGRINVNGSARVAHRVAYEQFVGPVPDGLELDHLCNNRKCVNTAHLEPVTHAENMRRARIRDVA